jgi:hypothetical protein
MRARSLRMVDVIGQAVRAAVHHTSEITLEVRWWREVDL